MHEWHTNRSRNPLNLINEFTGFEYDTDHSGRLKTEGVKILNKFFTTEDEVINFVTKQSYYSDYAYMAAFTTKKLLKGFQSAFSNFLTKYNDYINFKENLTIAYGRTANKVTCPNCGSSINLKYGNRFKVCPICYSKKIISDSNWKALETKKRIMEKAAENVSIEAEKNDLMFVCGMEWHC